MFKINKKFENNILIVSIQGYCESEAGKTASAIVKTAYTERQLVGAILDFTDCKVINSSCISQLMEIAELITYDFQSDVVVCGLDKTKISFFKMFGMLELAEVKDDVESAKHYLAE